MKVNFNRIKSATKFLCVKTSSGKVVARSFPLSNGPSMLARKVTVQPQSDPARSKNADFDRFPLDVLTVRDSKNNNATVVRTIVQLHSELFGRRHSTLRSHGLFALAKRLYKVIAKYNGAIFASRCIYDPLNLHGTLF